MKINNLSLSKVVLYPTIAFVLSSCELIVIGNKTYNNSKIIYNAGQDSPQGSFLMFKKELDNYNVPVATQLIKLNKLVAEKVEFYDEVARVGRVLKEKNFEFVSSDTIDQNTVANNLEIDLNYKLKVLSVKKDSLWYINNLEEIKLDPLNL